MVTIQDIAQKLKISKTTVSLVLNNRGKELRIGENTRNLVEKVSQEMGYTRNEIARSMVTGRNDVIAFVSRDTGAWEYTGKIMSGIMEEATRQRFAVKVYHLAHSTPDNITRQLMEQRVAGIIFHSEKNIDFDFIRNEAGKKHIPCATVNLSSTATGIGVTSDDFQGAKDVVKYLSGLGHRRIVHFSHQCIGKKPEYIRQRQKGYVAGMREYLGKSAMIRIESLPPVSTESEATDIIENILNEPAGQRPTAIFCVSDAVAMEVLQAAYRTGMKVPEYLSLVGFADLEMARYAVIPLTTVAQPFERMGRETANMLIDAIKNKRGDILDKAENRKLAVSLVVRESTARPKTEGRGQMADRIGEPEKRRR
ncbi:MAG: LacI family DNA-binding transcriptional regulator [Victivallales bacterium]